MAPVWTAVVSALVAVMALALNFIVLLVVTPRRDHARWRRDRIEEHILELLRLSRDKSYDMRNFQAMREEVKRRPEYLGRARLEQQRQYDTLVELRPTIGRFSDAVGLLGSERIDEATGRLGAAMGDFIELLTSAVHSVNPETVAFGPDYGRRLQAWREAEDYFFEQARLELGIGPSLPRRIWAWLKGVWPWVRQGWNRLWA